MKSVRESENIHRLWGSEVVREVVPQTGSSDVKGPVTQRFPLEDPQWHGQLWMNKLDFLSIALSCAGADGAVGLTGFWLRYVGWGVQWGKWAPHPADSDGMRRRILNPNIKKVVKFILYKVETDWKSVVRNEDSTSTPLWNTINARKTCGGAQVPQQQAACVLREPGDQTEMNRILLTIEEGLSIFTMVHTF